MHYYIIQWNLAKRDFTTTSDFAIQAMPSGKRWQLLCQTLRFVILRFTIYYTTTVVLSPQLEMAWPTPYSSPSAYYYNNNNTTIKNATIIENTIIACLSQLPMKWLTP